MDIKNLFGTFIKGIFSAWEEKFIAIQFDGKYYDYVLFISKSFVNFEQKIRNKTFDFASFEKRSKGTHLFLKSLWIDFNTLNVHSSFLHK